MNSVHGFQSAPPAGLVFRHYLGEQDLPAMLDVFRSACFGGHDLDHDETVLGSLEDITNKYHHLTNCDPYQDILIAERNGSVIGAMAGAMTGQMIAYGRVTWWQVEASRGAPGKRIYFMAWYIRPEWHGQGLDTVFLHRSEERLRQIIRQQDSQAPFSGVRLFEANASNLQPERARLLEEDGFQAVRWGSTMTCPDLQAVLEVPMPAGLEVRPAIPEDYCQIWDALWEAFHDDQDYVPPTESDYAGWTQSSQFQPDLWKIAWDGDQVAGMVLNYITHDPAGGGSGTAWTEDICVRRPWRRRGLARALLARSMRMFRVMGFTQTSLGVDLHNPHGARQFYEAMGYQPTSVVTIYQKPVDLVDS